DAVFTSSFLSSNWSQDFFPIQSRVKTLSAAGVASRSGKGRNEVLNHDFEFVDFWVTGTSCGDGVFTSSFLSSNWSQDFFPIQSRVKPLSAAGVASRSGKGRNDVFQP